jgi:hypothetical protein
MRKRTLVAVTAITLLVLGAIIVALGVGKMSVASAHTQTAVVHMQSNNQKDGPVQETPDTAAAVEKDSPDAAETPGPGESQDQNLPGGGHQDQGQADHQFEGTE